MEIISPKTVSSPKGDHDFNWDHGTDRVRTNTSHRDRKLVVRDADSNKYEYTPFAGALYYATDTEQWYIGDGTVWNEISCMSESPDFVAASIDNLTVEMEYDDTSIDTDRGYQ